MHYLCTKRFMKQCVKLNADDHKATSGQLPDLVCQQSATTGLIRQLRTDG